MGEINFDEIYLKITNIEFWGEHAGNKGGLKISWSSTIGFGELDLVNTENGITAFTECMDDDNDKSFTAKILVLLLDKIKIVE